MDEEKNKNGQRDFQKWKAVTFCQEPSIFYATNGHDRQIRGVGE